MPGSEEDRGVLYPNRLPSFHREQAPADLRGLIRWFWIPQWHLAQGRTSRQEILPFPASNLVVEPDGVRLAGPATAISHRDLTGSGWAVGALLRPGGIAALGREPEAIRDLAVPYDAPELLSSVRTAMRCADDDDRRTAAVRAWTTWAGEHLRAPDEAAALANAMEDLIAADPSVVRVAQVARHLGMSIRAVQRLARRYVGLPPLAMIRRYRLQEAAQRLRDDPSVTISEVAADLGYADHAHLSADFRRILGFTPNSYRQASSPRQP